MDLQQDCMLMTEGSYTVSLVDSQGQKSTMARGHIQ